MSLLKTDAVVIKSSDYSESTRLVTLFSPDQGRIRVLAKGIKRIKSRDRGALEPFARVQVTLNLKDPSALGTLRESTLVRSRSRLRSDYDRWLLASLVLELIDRATVPAEDSGELFERLCAYLDELETTDRAEESTVAVLTDMLGWFGFGPQFAPCSLCGGGGPMTGFRVDRCGATCERCAGGHALFRPLPPGSIRAFQCLAVGEEAARRSLRLSAQQRRQILDLVVALLEYHLDIRLTTGRMLATAAPEAGSRKQEVGKTGS